MAKPGTNNSTSKLEVETDLGIPWIDKSEQGLGLTKNKVSIDSESKPLYNQSSRTVYLRSVLDSRLEYTGQETGKLYIWDKAGSIVAVSEKDAIYLLEKRMGKSSCCGDSKDGIAVFEKVN